MPCRNAQSRRAFLKTAAVGSSYALASGAWPKDRPGEKAIKTGTKEADSSMIVSNDSQGMVNIDIEGWPGFHIGPLFPALGVDG